MRLTRIEVTKLFGMFDHVIPLKTEDRITLLLGPNGVGKTIVLRMLDALMTGQPAFLRSIPFETFVLTFDSGAKIAVTSRAADAEKPSARIAGRRRSPALPRSRPRDITCTVTLPDGDEYPEDIDWALGEPDPELLREVDRYIPSHLHLEGPAWRNVNTGKPVTMIDILDQYAARLPRELVNRFRSRRVSQVCSALRVRFVGTQRLAAPSLEAEEVATRRRRLYMIDTPELAVDLYAQDMAGRIQTVLGTYVDRSQALDRTFPERLLDRSKRPPALETQALIAKLGDLENRRAQLVELGFLDQEGGRLPQLHIRDVEENREVLSMYVRDVEEKLGFFEEPAARSRLLMNLVNARFGYTAKKLTFHRDLGFSFSGPMGTIPPDKLSSGEQHELVLLYELLFRAQPNSLVLIDEPELSLHVGWQKRFLDDLKDIVALSKFDAIVATHSPVIIGEHWDLRVELKVPETGNA